MDENKTRLFPTEKGNEILEFKGSHLSVRSGPDKGKSIEVASTFFRVGTGTECDLILSDPSVSREHLEIELGPDGYLIRDLDSTNGSSIGPLVLGEIRTAKPVRIQLGTTEIDLAPAKETIRIPLSLKRQFGSTLGASTVMRQLFATLERIVKTDETILLLGESGTGKELLAEAIHSESNRKESPFIVLDCGAIPENLIESELFGHKKGAFTGATESRRGAIDSANHGTLFLDEIGELPLSMQPRLLRFLEKQQYSRVGETHYNNVDVRVIAATHRNLAEEVKADRFRQDLYYRLNVMEIAVPTLRRREGDVELLAHHFLRGLGADPHELLSSEILKQMKAHRWPGNVRELRNFVKRLVLIPERAMESLSTTSSEAMSSVPKSMISSGVDIDVPFHECRQRTIDEFEHRYVSALLEHCSENIQKAATKAGLPRQTIYRLMKRCGIRRG